MEPSTTAHPRSCRDEDGVLLFPQPELARVRVGASTNDLERYVAQQGRGYWSVDLPFYGPSKVIAAQWEYAKERFSRIAGVQFRDGASYRFPLSAADLEKIPNAKPAVLAERTDLTAAGVKGAVRNGMFVMPRFRKTEVSDAALEAVNCVPHAPAGGPEMTFRLAAAGAARSKNRRDAREC